MYKSKDVYARGKSWSLSKNLVKITPNKIASETSYLSRGTAFPTRLRGCAGWSEFSLGPRAILYECCAPTHLIMKTCLYNFDPLKPHFYIVKLGFTGVYIIFHISAQNIDCRYSLEPPRRGGSNGYPQSMFWAEIWKKIRVLLSENFPFFEVKFSIYLNRRVFVMCKVFNGVAASIDKVYTICHASRRTGVCLCWGFTAQSIQWGHVERGQFT